MQAPYTSLRTLVLSTTMIVVGLGIVGGATGTILGSKFRGAWSARTAPTSPNLTEEEKQWIAGARMCAEGGLSELVSAHPIFLAIIDIYGGDNTLWHGVRRLVDYALARDVPDGAEVARRLLRTFSLRTPPAIIREKIPALKRRFRDG